MPAGRSLALWFLGLCVCLITLPAVEAALHSRHDAHEESRIPARWHHRDVAPHLIRLSTKAELRCPTGIVEHLTSARPISEIVEQLDFSPECLWGTILDNAKGRSEVVHGFTFGTDAEISMSVGALAGTELVIMKHDEQSLMVGQVTHKSWVAAWSLPGVSLTQSVIYGDCPEAIFSYLGWFDSAAAVAITHSHGKAGYALPLLGQRSHCDAVTSVRGTNSPIVGVSQSYYEQKGSFAIVTGPRVMPLLKLLRDLNEHKRD